MSQFTKGLASNQGSPATIEIDDERIVPERVHNFREELGHLTQPPEKNMLRLQSRSLHPYLNDVEQQLQREHA